HGDPEARGVMNAVGRAQPIGVVIVGPATNRVLTFGRDRVRTGETLFPLTPQLVLNGEDLVAAPRLPFTRCRSSVGDRIVLVLHPFPNIASEIVVSIRPAPGRMRTDRFGASAAEHRPFMSWSLIPPREAAAVGAAHGAFELGFARKALP